MSWFERQADGRQPEQVAREHARYVRASGLDRALEGLSGPYGVRRFLLRYRAAGGQVRVTALEAEPLGFGGGPPPDDPSGKALVAVEQALTRLFHNMATGPAWSRGAVGYVRDAKGSSNLLPAFDEDGDELGLDRLATPPPPGHPLEAPTTRRELAAWEGPMAEVHQRTAATVADWDDWEVKDDHTLLLHHGGDLEAGVPPRHTRRHRCSTLATFEPAWSRFTWRTEGPLFATPAIYGAEPFASTWDAAMELGLLATARLQADWLFVQPYDERGSVLMVAVFR